MKLEYINNNPLDGIKYDYKAVRKEFKKLGIPKTVYDPCHLPLESCSWLVTLSERARGKTTNLLLMGMCFFSFPLSVFRLIGFYCRFDFSFLCSYTTKKKRPTGRFLSIVHSSAQ
mgnify:CR=1 FL=1